MQSTISRTNDIPLIYANQDFPGKVTYLEAHCVLLHAATVADTHVLIEAFYVETYDASGAFSREDDCTLLFQSVIKWDACCNTNFGDEDNDGYVHTCNGLGALIAALSTSQQWARELMDVDAGCCADLWPPLVKPV